MYCPLGNLGPAKGPRPVPADILNATRAHGKSRNPSSALVCGTCHDKEFAEKKPDLGGDSTWFRVWFRANFPAAASRAQGFGSLWKIGERTFSEDAGSQLWRGKMRFRPTPNAKISGADVVS